MATDFVATTPTRAGSPASIHTPQTPRLGGFGDNWEPYTPAPRKSARLSSRTSTNRTPSPHASGRTTRPSHPRTSPKPTSSGRPQKPADISSPPATMSPQKKRQPPTSSRSVSGSLTAESIRTAAAALGQSQQKMDSFASRSVQAAALPTPAKTPARKHSEQAEKDVNSVARNLFGKQPSPKKSRAKRYNGISLDSFEIEDETIQIYTDSQDRLPEPDHSTENPFYGDAGIAASAAPVRRSSRNKKNAAAEKDKVEENLKRDDGLLYVFRGKKVFRKFSDIEAASRFTVQPRLLFPSAKASKENDVIHTDEEAETDIDEQTKKQAGKSEEEIADASAEVVEEKVNTPKAPRFAPASPPATSRATRSKKIVADEPTPVKAKGKRSGPRSPFDGWRRTKTSPSSSSQGQKRLGDELPNAVAPKRAKAQGQQ